MKRLFTTCITLSLLFFTMAFSPGDYYEKNIEKRPFDQQRWEKLVRDLDYTEQPPPPPEEEKERTGRSTPPLRDPVAFGDNFLDFFKWFFILTALGLLVWLLITVLRSSGLFAPGFKKIKTPAAITLDLIEENLHESDLEAFIQEALHNRQYNLAIRLYYLSVLKSLSQKELIHWKKEKTNRAYLQEMQQHHLFQDFRDVTRVFEQVWYGDNPVSETDFLAVQGRLLTLQGHINNG